jgi:hypothetical protein
MTSRQDWQRLQTFIVELPSSGDLSADVGKAVIIDTNGQVALAAGAEHLGVLVSGTTVQGDLVAVALLGLINVVSGAAVAAGDSIIPDGTGRFIQVGPGSIPTGFALEAAAGAGETIRAISARYLSQ